MSSRESACISRAACSCIDASLGCALARAALHPRRRRADAAMHAAARPPRRRISLRSSWRRQRAAFGAAEPVGSRGSDAQARPHLEEEHVCRIRQITLQAQLCKCFPCSILLRRDSEKERGKVKTFGSKRRTMRGAVCIFVRQGLLRHERSKAALRDN